MESYSTEEIQKEYGCIKSVKFQSYWKYIFALKIQTTKGYTLLVRTGGNPDDIYRYNPNSITWSEHSNANIQSITVLEKKDADVSWYEYFRNIF